MAMTSYRISQAARLMGVSDDTVRRWVEAGKLTSRKDAAGRAVVDGAELAAWATTLAAHPESPHHSSARNRLEGLVTAIKSDSVMSQVDLQCGPYRLVSLLSTEAVQELNLQVGSVVAAVIKSTNVIVEAS